MHRLVVKRFSLGQLRLSPRFQFDFIGATVSANIRTNTHNRSDAADGQQCGRDHKAERVDRAASISGISAP
jgi:hypothetical protein